MGEIPDWLAQLASDSEQAPDELKRGTGASGDSDAMPDMTAALEDILAYGDAPAADASTDLFSDQNEVEPLSFMGESGSNDSSWDSPVFAPDTVFFDDDEEDLAAEQAAQRETVMMDGLRTQAKAALPADLAQTEPDALDRVNLIFSRTGLKAWQLTVLVVLLLLDIVVIGLLFLTMLGIFQF